MTKSNSKRNNRSPRIPAWHVAAASVLLLFVLALSARAQTINPGVIDPTNTYAGKTYSQWSAGFWQYYMSLPTTNSPFVFSSVYPVSPLSTGQSGRVWFLCGNYANGGTHAYTNTIPGGIALFAGITDIHQDNSGCPPTSYSEAQLRSFAKSAEDTAENMTCSIDGVLITGISNVLTTPYRVQSTLFSYTCPAVHNILHDLFEETCYQDGSGTPYTNNGAVEDGVFLLIAPLSVGPHVIHTTCAFPFSPPFVANFTHYLTVKPVALMVSGIDQAGSLMLTWPQTPDHYTLESATSLSSLDWQTNGLSVTLSNGVYQTAAPMGTDRQFFRLRLN